MRTHAVQAVIVAVGVGVLSAIGASILLPIDRESRTLDGRLATLAGELAEAGLQIEDPYHLDVTRQVLTITVTAGDATCATWSAIAAGAVSVAEASGLAEYEREIRVRDDDGLVGFWGAATSDGLDVVEAASDVCDVDGIAGYGVVADRVELYGDVTRAGVAAATPLVEQHGLLLLQRVEPEA